MKKIILTLIILFCSTSFGQILKFDEWGGNLYTSTNAEIYGLNNVPLRHLLGGKYTFSRAGADLEALFDKIDSLTLAMSSLNILDDGLTTQILVGGGLNVVPVWGTNLPTAITIGSAYIYRAGGTDVADGDVADTITITNISQVQDITATATEINYTTDVTSNIQAQIDSKQDTVLGITSAEIAFLDGLTDTIQQQLDLKAPLTAPTFATSITGSYLTASEILGTDASKNIVSLAVATYPSLTELTYVKGVTSAIQAQMNLKAPLVDPTFTNIVTIKDTLTLGSDADNISGVLQFIASDGDIFTLNITTSDYFYIEGGDGLTFNGDPKIFTQATTRGYIQLMGSGGLFFYTGAIALTSNDIVFDIVSWSGADGRILFGDTGTATETIAIDSTGAMVIGTPTAGSKGSGTLNAVAVYDDGVLLTGADYVFSKNYEDYTQFSIDQMRDFYFKNKHLPTITSWTDNPEERPSIGKLAFQLLETVEVQAKYIAELEERMTKLEEKLEKK